MISQDAWLPTGEGITMKICDNKSVGILVRNGRGELLFIERKKYNYGFAPVAGHLDGDQWEAAAAKELAEEVGLAAGSYKILLQKSLQNPCKREGGTHHLWRVYEASGMESFDIKPSEDETKSYLWVDSGRLRALAARLEEFMSENGLSLGDLPAVVGATNMSSFWRANPGLEPPWYVLLKELKII